MPARQNNIDPALVTRLLPPEVSLSHKVNAIGLAVIRKCIEVIGVAQLLRELRRLHGLQMRMGTRATEDEYGRIVASYQNQSKTSAHIYQGVTNVQTAIPAPKIQQYIRDYHDVLRGYFKCTGDSFVVKNPAMRLRLEEAEETFHKRILELNTGQRRPEWALQPLPTLRRIRSPIVICYPTIDLTNDDPRPTPKRKRDLPPTPAPTPKRKRDEDAGEVIDLTGGDARKTKKKRDVQWIW
ncbi:hypothetical protein GGX14DRAFT_393605 [Mycena pura]|uniref:Uncharacterized protein n=1 Tax=Mycena pura TaxID=153505 RepID=A0AAD6YD64_9AGAR|nr:hypothetical protein GGX14DRAFT_393605 [Mycena pura]